MRLKLKTQILANIGTLQHYELFKYYEIPTFS